MRKSATYFEQIPVWKVKELMMIPESQGVESMDFVPVRHALLCHICRKPVAVETAKTDAYGQAVHEDCYIVSLTRKPALARTRPPVL
jgi:hypothetical protein